jgi:glycerophosphoryl diester phosphodiesterase
LAASLISVVPLPPPLPPVIGHRGAAARAPENTLAGFRAARALGCGWVEFDVRLTADGVPVVCHDPRLERTTNGHGVISELTFASIRAVDAGLPFGAAFAGERVPTLLEALTCCGGLGLGANIEIKAEHGREYATAATVAAAVREVNGRAPAMLISSFQPAAVATLQRLCHHVPRGILFRLVPRQWAQIAARLECTVIGADHRRLRRRDIAQIRTAGYQLAAYTVNDAARARTLFGWGVTSVFSDVPDIISHTSTWRGAAR